MQGSSKPAVATEAPLVSVVVPCRNEIHHIEDTLRLILAQEKPPGDFEVIVAEGMSDDGTREILLRLAQEHPCLRIVENSRGIVSTGLNAAIREAQGSIILRMDAHTRYAPDYIRQCVQALEETGADNVGGPWVACGRGRVGQAFAAAFQSSLASGGARAHDPSYSGSVDTVYLGCWRREIFDRVGLFDEELVRNQDDEFNLRLVRSGCKIWQSVKIKSWYYPRETLRHLFAQYVQYGYWKARVLQKHRQPASIRHLVPAGFVLTLALLAILSIFWPVVFPIWLGLLTVYVIIILIVSCVVASAAGWKLFPVLPLIFWTFHFAYGWGFLSGLLNFVILKRQPAQSYRALTRASSREV